MRNCRKCHQDKPIEDFEVTNKERGWRRRECRACVKLRVQGWYVVSKQQIRKSISTEKSRAQTRAWQKGIGHERHKEHCLSSYYRLQHETIMAYGGYECKCCGETNPLFLSIDHVDNNGTEHRKSFQSHGTGLYRWLKQHGYPEGFQVLCMNCNFGKRRNYGVCPHEGFSDKVNAFRRQVQRLSGNGVEPSGSKHLAARTAGDIV